MSTLHLVNIDQIRHLIPSELEILAVWPGKTLGGSYLSYYESESVLKYSELIIIPAFVGYRGKIGSWISHIYVDNPDSVAGGREIWGLPKEMAEFTWEQGKRVTVRQDNKMLCCLDYEQAIFTWPQWFGGLSFSTQDAHLLKFDYELEARLGFTRAQLEIPMESPFAEVGLGRPFCTVRVEQMGLRVYPPEVVAKRTTLST